MVVEARRGVGVSWLKLKGRGGFVVEVKGAQGYPWLKFGGRGGSLSLAQERGGGFVIEAGRGFRC